MVSSTDVSTKQLAIKFDIDDSDSSAIVVASPRDLATTPVPTFKLELCSRIYELMGYLFLGSATGALGISAGLIAAPSVTIVDQSPAEIAFAMPEIIAIGEPFDTLDSKEFQSFQKRWIEDEIRRNLEDSEETLAGAREEADKTIRSAKKQAEEMTVRAGYEIAPFRPSAPPGSSLVADVDLSVINTNETSVGCNLTIFVNGETHYATNIAKGTCAKQGSYKAGKTLGEYGHQYTVGVTRGMISGVVSVRYK